jgi:branched-chain amino acid transport system substrate-binding protein
MLKRSWQQLMLLVVCAVLCGGVVAACGGSSSSSSSSATSSSSSTSAGSSGGSSTSGSSSKPSGSPVKIGIIAPVNSPTFNLPDSIGAVQAGITALNKRGGLDGHPVQMDWCNDKSDPNQTVTCARQMVSDGVIAVVGGGPLNGQLTVPIFEAGQIPNVGVNAITEPQLNSKAFFLLGGGSSLTFPLLAAYAAKTDTPTSQFYADNPTSLPLIKGIEATAKAAGKPFVANVPVETTQADFAPIVAAGMPNTAKAAMLVLGYEQDAQVISASEQAGAKWTYLNSGEPEQNITRAFGGPTKVTNWIYATPFLAFTSKNPMIVQYLAQLKAEAATGNTEAADALKYPSSQDFQGWLGIQVIEKLVKSGAVKQLTHTAVWDALNQTKDMNLDRVVPPWSPDVSAGVPGESRVNDASYNLVQITNGVAKQITPKAVSTAQILAGKVTFTTKP